MTRYTRQIRLPEVGAAGQGRLAAARVALGAAPGGLARTIEETYVRAAGMGVGDGEPCPVDVAALGLANAAAREVGEGALRALVAMRAALGVGSGIGE